MTLDHGTGELQGEVLSGPFKDWLLSEMNLEQLKNLFDFCQAQDPDSEQLLISYLEQRFPDGWQNEDGGQSDRATPQNGGMSRSEALAVLGVDEDASEDAIIAAHRSLIQKLHPDRGGNDYLAAKINEAKDFLLKTKGTS